MSTVEFRTFVLPYLALLSCLLAGCRPPPLMSYPWSWDYTRAKPKESDLVAQYKILKIRLTDGLAKPIREQDPSVTLNADHTASLFKFPHFDGFGDRVDCSLSGTANWSLDEGLGIGDGWQLKIENYRSDAQAKECGPGNAAWPIVLLGQKPPYRLYLSVGDPDSDTGIEFQRK